ncbi:unnamed protein product [Meloidogyne enterolobii]|uniref:Uncharacterized protein n=1 Tax=Meloidogyne enterolobii TaxID=390850 RepID=A0ACB0YGS3_MELEN
MDICVPSFPSFFAPLFSLDPVSLNFIKFVIIFITYTVKPDLKQQIGHCMVQY